MKASIIIRTKNEEKWIKRCLVSVMNQDIDDKEIIIVDDHSSDRTLEIAKEFNVNIVTYTGDYFPGKALNLGAKEATGEYLVFLSAHCIPLNDKWLERLIVDFDDPAIAAVYGKQEPLPDSALFDKRDLWTVFGNEKRLQKEDYYFHNANSIIRSDVFRKVQFDEILPSLEDRAWAQKILAMGYSIVYEPKASVYHFHGINQGYNPERAERVVKVIELLQSNGNGNVKKANKENLVSKNKMLETK